jgi:hypothetical protein
LVDTDEEHQKDHTVGEGKFLLLDFEQDPKFKDMPHLFLERDGSYHEVMLPNGWPTSSDKQKKVIDTNNDISKEELEKYLEGGTPRGEGEERMGTPGGGAIANVTKHLEGIDFPAKPKDLIEHAHDEGAPSEVIDKLETLPVRDYKSMADVTEEIGERTEELPIDNYDKLSVQEAASKVQRLSGHDLEIVEAHERDHKNRATIIKVIDAKENKHVPDDYHELKAGELIEQLDNMSKTQLEELRDFEKKHMSRQSVLQAIDEHLNQ